MQKLFLSLIILTLCFNVRAQHSRSAKQERRKAQINQMVKQEEEGVITYRKSFAFGAKLISDGYGIFFELGRANSVKKGLLYQLEISERKSQKEQKQSNYSNTVPFIYGKENFIYPVKLGLQQQILLGNKSNKNGVAITGNYGGGIALSLLRPYYIQVQDGGGYKYIKYNSADSVQFLTDNSIIGGPGFGRGWNELSVIPGVYGKAAVRFDYGMFNEIISALEVGVTGEYYAKKVPLMAYNKANTFFFGGYVAIIFGKRK